MGRKQTRRWVLLGVLCALLLAGASWYTLTYDQGRILQPMDYSTYVFRPQDLPMLLAVACLVAYLLALVVLVVRWASRRQPTQVSRTVSPKLGLLGLLGILGFLGIWTYGRDGTVFPFVFFLFFGFFGFFYEGKSSGGLMDERWKENRLRARGTANRVALTIILVATVILGQGRFQGNLEYTFLAYLIVVSLALALNIFLGEYLFYRYDHGDPAEEEG